MYKSITTRNQSLFILIIILFSISGCLGAKPSTPEDNALTIFKTLQTAKEFRHTGLSIVGDFYKKGLVSEDNKKEVIKIGNELKEIITVSFECLEVYIKTKNDKSLNILNTNLQLYNEIYTKFSNLIIPYLIKEATGDNTNG